MTVPGKLQSVQLAEASGRLACTSSLVSSACWVRELQCRVGVCHLIQGAPQRDSFEMQFEVKVICC